MLRVHAEVLDDEGQDERCDATGLHRFPRFSAPAQRPKSVPLQWLARATVNSSPKTVKTVENGDSLVALTRCWALPTLA
jgi:hypothetical protein